MKHGLKTVFFVLMVLGLSISPFLVQSAKADNLYARIQGTVIDPSGAALGGVKITATNIGTNIPYETDSMGDGHFVLLNLPIGTYKVTATTSGFRTYTATGITLVLDQVYALDIKMELGQLSEQVIVEAARVQVETANTQLGAVISGTTIQDMPLIGRNWTQLQLLQPGVMASSDRFGTYSTNGSQSQQNSFLINGQDSNDLPLNTPLIIPSPDAIAEFNMITNTINPEYGRNSGAIMSASIRSGTNNFHGTGFEFYRDTFMNAADFFTQKPQIFHQNQFGGTIGGPVIKNHTFFFFSYQGARFRQPQASSTQTVYSQAERGGDFSQGADVDSATGVPFIAESTVVAPFALYGDSKSPCPVSGGVQCVANTTTFAQLFSTGVIPKEDLNSLALKLMNDFVPLPNGPNNAYNFNAVSPGTDNQYLFQIDQVFNAKDTIRFYGYFQTRPTQDTLPFTGATLPGFPQYSKRHYKQFTAGWTHVFNPNIMNEFRVGYTRFNYLTVEPVNVVQPSSYGFNINPNITSGASLPYVGVAGTGAGQVNFSLGFSYNGPQPRIDQTYQLDENFSHVLGRHTLKFGYNGRKFGVFNPFGYVNNGYFPFAAGGEFTTGNAGADFLLGIPDSYTQSSGNVMNDTAYGHYLYAQDSWKATQGLTLNYGLGWQINTPLTDHGPLNNDRAINCFLPGQQSKIYPDAPQNLLVPGDPGCTPSGYSIGYKHFGPRFGFAWSPQTSGGKMQTLTGGPGKFSIRGGFGIYYNQIEEEISLQNLLAVPFGLYDYGVGDIGLSPGFADPWADIAGRGSIQNKYPYVAPKPGSTVDFTFFAPISMNVIDPKFSVPYSMNFNLTAQRELPGQMILSIAYVGAQGRHLVRAFDINEANLGACKAIPSCIATTGSRYYQGYSYPQNFPYSDVIPGTTSLYIGGVGVQATDGNSKYDSLQASLQKRVSHGLDFLLAYTYAHARDNGSGYESSSGQQGGTRGVNPFISALNWGDSQFDARHRFVASFNYEIPVPQALSSGAFLSRVFKGWQIAGSTTFQTGFPMSFTDSSYRSGTCWAYTYYGCADNPNQVAPIVTQDPRSTSKHLYFNSSAFARAAVGTFGNTARNTLHGPGINSTNLALLKNIAVREGMRFQLRLESQNTFNHVNFNLPNANINSSNFGRITGDVGPRLVQLGVKFYF